MHIKTNDLVVVITGNDKPEAGSVETHKVLAIDRAAGKVTVEGVNRVYKHVRRSQKNPQGGRLNKEMPIQISNVLLYCSRCNKGVRTGSRLAKSGAKERFCKKCGTSLGEISPPKKKVS
jgi:large subunit ribosomal protein L24